jgi:hypothetical protein
MAKYVTVEISGVINQIAKEPDVKGYTEGVLECFMPDGKEIRKLSKKQTALWIKENNNRMNAICKFLNENDL